MRINNIEQVIRTRSSIRDFKLESINDKTMNIIEEQIKQINNSKTPFNNFVKLSLIKTSDLDKSIKLGTYGVIKNAQYYLIATHKGEEYSNFDLGYQLEKMVLFLTSINLGSVILGGTYNKKSFRNLVELTENQEIICICPFGMTSEKKSHVKSMISKINKRRHDYNKLFFKNQNLNKLEYEDCLEAIRLAPSALNSQPWRVVKENNHYHFYTKSDSNKELIDLGIAFAHFDLVNESKYINGAIYQVTNNYLKNYRFSYKIQ